MEIREITEKTCRSIVADRESGTTWGTLMKRYKMAPFVLNAILKTGKPPSVQATRKYYKNAVAKRLATQSKKKGVQRSAKRQDIDDMNTALVVAKTEQEQLKGLSQNFINQLHRTDPQVIQILVAIGMKLNNHQI